MLSNLAFSQTREETYNLLWKIEGKGLSEASYLFGTIHINDERAFAFSDSVLTAFQAADILALEVTTDDYLKYVLANRERGGRNEMKAQLGKENYQVLREKVMDESQIDINQLSNINPMLIERLLNRKMTNSNEKRKLDLDNYFFYTAKRLGKEVIGLEKIGDGVRAASGFNSDFEQKYFVKRYIESKDSSSGFDTSKFFESIMTQEFDKMVKLYYEGDVEAMADRYTPRERDLLDMVGRNKQMVARLDTLMKEASVFCAVGAAHLGGEQGMIDLLKSKGYTLTPVQASFTGVAKKLQKEFESAPGYLFEDLRNGFSVQMSGVPIDINIPNSNVKAFMYQDIGNNSMEMVMTVNYPEIFIDKEQVIDQLIDNIKGRQKFEILGSESLETEGLDGRVVFMGKNDVEMGRLKSVLENGKAYLFFYMQMTDSEMPEKLPFLESIEIFDISEFESLQWEETKREDYAISLMLPTQVSTFDQEIQMDEDPSATMVNNIVSFVDKVAPFSGNFQRFIYPREYEIATNQELREVFVTNIQEEYNATLLKDSVFNYQAYDVYSREYVMQDSVTIKEVHFSRGNYVYYWTAQYMGEPTEEIEKFLYQWEVLPWGEPDLVTYETEDFSMLQSHENGYSGIDNYNNALDTMVLHSSLDRTTGITTFLYEYGYNELGYFSNTDSLVSYYGIGPEGKNILKADTLRDEAGGYAKTVYQDTAYSSNTYEYIKWNGNKVYVLYVTTPLDIEASYAERILASFTLKPNDTFSLFESKLDTLVAMVQSTDTATFERVSGMFSDYPFTAEEANELKKVLQKGIPLDEGSWDSPGNDMIAAIAKLEQEEAIVFFKELYADTTVYQSAILEELQAMKTESSLETYKALLPQKNGEMVYSDFQVYRDSLSLVSEDLPMIMKLFEKSGNKNTISSLLASYNDEIDTASYLLTPYADQFSTSFRAVADTINTEEDYSWDSYYLDRLFELSIATGAKAKSFRKQYDRLLAANAPTLKMIGVLGYLNAGISIKKKLAKEVLQYEEEAEFLLDRIKDERDIDFLNKYFDMETISRIYIRSFLTYEDYYDVKMAYVDTFKKSIADTTYTFYVFTYYDEYAEAEMISFSVFAMEDKRISTHALYTDIYLGEHDPADFDNEKEAIVEDFKTYYLEIE